MRALAMCEAALVFLPLSNENILPNNKLAEKPTAAGISTCDSMRDEAGAL